MIKDILTNPSPMIALIKAYRQETGCSLLEAKHAVDRAFSSTGEHIVVADYSHELFPTLQSAMDAAQERVQDAFEVYVARVVARTKKTVEYV